MNSEAGINRTLTCTVPLLHGCVGNIVHQIVAIACLSLNGDYTCEFQNVTLVPRVQILICTVPRIDVSAATRDLKRGINMYGLLSS